MKNIQGFIFVCLIAWFNHCKGQSYWVIETSLRQKNFTIIRFYNTHHQLIYEQKEIGVYFKASKKNHKRQLDLMLENYLRSGSPIAKKENKRRSNKGF